LPGKAGPPRSRNKVEIGWCEMVDVPSLGLFQVHAKMDTGAATSSIHASRIKPIYRDDILCVEFWFRLNAGEKPRRFEAPVIDRRIVRSSNGEKQDRYVIAAQFCFGNLCWNGQLTLANRRSMTFSLLIGRRALRRGFVVNSARRWVLGTPADQGIENNENCDVGPKRQPILPPETR
jgi:hypothetical protein